MKFINLYLSSLLLFFISLNCFTQHNASAQSVINKCPNCSYKALDIYQEFLAGIAQKNTQKLDKQYQKEYSAIILEKNKELISEFKEENFLFDTVLHKFLSSVFYAIIDKNGLDKNLFHFFVSRTAEVNAYTYEDGTIVCNLGILNVTETESQIAMVLCHEIAHFLLDHPNRSIVKSIENLHSAELLAKVKEIKKEKYNTKTQLETLMEKDLFDRRRHNRGQELAADSLGMILLSKTNYGSAYIPHLFNLLDSSEILTVNCSSQSYFKKENIPVQDSWFKIPQKMRFGAAPKEALVDSLKTHPDCSKRKVYAEKYFARNPKAGTDFLIATDTKLAYYKELALNAEAKYSKDMDNLSLYLYQLIQNDAVYPKNNNIGPEIFDTFLTIFTKQKNHTLGSSIDKPYTPDNPKDEYAKLLQFLDQIDLQKLREITLLLYAKYQSAIKLDAIQNANFTKLKQL